MIFLPNARDRWLLTILPALLLLLGYRLVILRPIHKEMMSSSREIQELGPMDALRAKEDSVRKQEEELQLSLYLLQQEREKEGDELPAVLSNAPDVLRQVSLLCKEFDLQYIGSAPATLAAPSPIPELKRAYRFEMRGSFQSAKSMLSAMADRNLPILPFSLKMRRGYQGQKNHQWVFDAWL